MTFPPDATPRDAAPQPPLLEADALSRHYRVSRGLFRPAATVRALDGVGFTLQRGETLAIVGESGCGKSTLARLLARIEAPTAGRLRLGGIDIATATPTEQRELRRQVQMVFQNPYASLNPRKRIGQMLDEPLRLNTPLPAAARRERVAAMLAQVGLRPEHAARYPHMFSGGQRQRIAIARAMMLGPALLVADEPTSALDVSIQAQILNLLMDLQQRSGLSCVFISHNLGVVKHVAQRVIVMYLGRAVESAPVAALFSQPLHPYTQLLLSAAPRLDGNGHAAVPLAVSGEPPSPLNPPSGCAFHQRCAYAQPRCTAERPELREVAKRQVACHFAETWSGGHISSEM